MVNWTENELPSSRVDPAPTTMPALNDLHRPARSRICVGARQTMSAEATKASALLGWKSE